MSCSAPSTNEPMNSHPISDLRCGRWCFLCEAPPDRCLRAKAAIPASTCRERARERDVVRLLQKKKKARGNSLNSLLCSGFLIADFLACRCIASVFEWDAALDWNRAELVSLPQRSAKKQPKTPKDPEALQNLRRPKPRTLGAERINNTI